MFDFEANNTVVRTWWKQSWAEKLTQVLKTVSMIFLFAVTSC